MRICFRSMVDPEYLSDYRKAHEQVSSDMLCALKDAGWHEYTLHLGEDGLLIGVVECDDFDAVRTRMALTDVNTRWQAAMARLFPASESAPDVGFVVMDEVFNLENQLAAAGFDSEGMLK